MDKSLENWSRAGLVAEVERLRIAFSLGDAGLAHEVAVHREELSQQFEQLQSTQQLLQASRDEYVDLYEFAPVPYLTLDASGMIRSINLTACMLLQSEPRRMQGLPFSGFVQPADRQTLLEHMRRCRLSTTEQVTAELTLQTVSGTSYPALLVSRRTSDNTFRTIAFDRTEQLRLDEAIRDLNARLEERVMKRTEELEQTNQRLTQEIDQRIQAEEALKDSHRRKDEFLAMLGHELRNPLSPIRNGAAIIKLLGRDNSDLVQVSDVIERQVQHMARIVDDLLDVSRITRGKIRIVKKPLSLCPLLMQVVDDFEPMVKEGQLLLKLELVSRELWVEGDSVRLSQVFGNLLHNACKFTPAEGKITVRLERLPDSNEATLTVRDTGIGIRADVLPQLFVPFHQGTTSTDRSRGGLGLGLSLVRGLTELHGGHADISSPGPGQGTVCTVRLPLIATPIAAHD